MSRLHVHISVDDLEQNIRFYSALFGTAPSVSKEDYAKWDLADPAVNFAISRRGAQTGCCRAGRGAGAPAGCRHQRCCAEWHRLLLRAFRQVLDPRPAGHRLGGLPHTGFHSDLQ